MKNTLLFCRTAALLLTAVCHVHAALEWNEKEISIEVRRGAQDEVRAKFDFRNAGKSPVTILGVTTSCGCTVANAETSTVSAGEKSNIQALFTIGDRHGRQEKKITISTDDPDNPEIVLMFKINILESVPANPSSSAAAGGTAVGS